MRKIAITLTALTVLLSVVSCGSGSGKHEATAEGFSEIEKEIKGEFGNDAYFTDIMVLYNKDIGTTVNVTTTNDPESLKMGEWNQMQGSWVQSSEISLEVPEGTKAVDFMYQLNDKINLTKLGELIEKSKKQLTDEKKLDNPTLTDAYISFPKNGDESETEYRVNLKPESGGTTFRFTYKLIGELVKMDY
jgi:hypothetical protein